MRREEEQEKKAVSAAGLDKISNLPNELIEKILTLIPIRDIVKTCILSKTWKNTWMYVPRLRFDSNTCSPVSSSIEEGGPTQTSLVNFVNNVITRHKCIICSFYLEDYLDSGCSEIDQWMLFLSSIKMLQHLVLQFDKAKPYQVPDSVFSCQALNGLILRGCILQLPSQFNGFSRLYTLKLYHVNLTREAIETLISKSPFLRHLKVWKCSFSSQLSIHAPKLKTCCVRGPCKLVDFRYTPKLDDVTVGRWSVGIHYPCKLNKVLRGIVKVKKLKIEYPYMEVKISFLILGMTFRRLKYVEFHVNYDDSKQMLAVLCLCMSSPNLEELHIKIMHGKDSLDHEEHLWEAQLKKKQKIFGHLKMMKLARFNGARHEFELLQFVLVNAVDLETLTIEYWKESPHNEHEKLSMEEKVRQFERASPTAMILFSTVT
ncbi:hypothetical protein AQUCO_01000378v1 [Aquilegia coerulea]|uniref:F-box domain-containing protein n=1 Tax=Aquilegia coerulea TaxID=218851 RepID=A0A2G5EA79_AQUCA|nr:hypothetical protein AQUCO_01000378v1 [Aquilegia coerulea]